MASLIIAAGLIYFIGHLLTHFFERSKIPDVLMLILFGVLVGPVLGIMTPDRIGEAGNLFTQLALIIILFEGGLNLELSNLVHSARPALLLTVTCFVLSTAVIALLMFYAFGYSPMAAVLTGFICAGTSSAVVIPLLAIIKVGKSVSVMLVLESALTDVLCIVFALGQLQSYESGEFKIASIVGTLIASLLTALLIGVVAAVVWLRMLNWVRTFPSTQFATCFFMFLVYGVAEMFNFSGAIAALAFGVMLGNAAGVSHSLAKIFGNILPVGVISDAERKLYRELVFLVKIFFFIYIGICIPFEHLGIIEVSLSIVAALFALRPWIARFTVGRNVPARDRTFVAVMLPKGLAAAVLAGLPTQYGMIEGPDIQAITYHVVLASIIVTSVLIPLVERTAVGRFYDRIVGSPTDIASEAQQPRPTSPPHAPRERSES